MIYEQSDSHRVRVVSDLRRAARYFEANPDLPVPESIKITVSPHHYAPIADDASMIAEVNRVAAIMGTALMVSADYYLTTREIGLVVFEVVGFSQAARDRASRIVQDAIKNRREV